MIVREVQPADIDYLVEMGLRMHEESAYAFLPYDRGKVRRLIVGYIEDRETQCGLVAEDGQKIIGMLGGYLVDYFFCDEKLACDMLVFVERGYRGGSAAQRLVRAFREWAIQRGVRELCLAISTNINTERTGQFYERMGLIHIGNVYKQRLP